MGLTKRILSVELMERAQCRSTAQGGLLHYGQGKWYPGEQLPRWSLNLYWRKDGEPLWHDPALLGRRACRPRRHRGDRGRVPASPGDAPRRRARQRLSGIRRRVVLPLARAQAAEQRRSLRFAPRRPAWSARACAGCSSAGWTAPVGYALPVGVDERRPGTLALQPWYLRDNRCYLIPGDSPIGYRLPLDSLPWAAPATCPGCTPRSDPAAAAAAAARRSATTTRAGMRPQSRTTAAADASRRRAARTTSGGDDRRGRRRDRDAADAIGTFAPAGTVTAPKRRGASSARSRSAGFVVRTAISAEPREGRLYVFMPPTATLEDYLDLVAAVEDTAAAMQMPVILEGYEPPRDPRLQVLAGHARSGRDRGQRPSGARAGASWST